MKREQYLDLNEAKLNITHDHQYLQPNLQWHFHYALLVHLCMSGVSGFPFFILYIIFYLPHGKV